MNLVETIFESLKKEIKQKTGQIPYDIEIYCIGSGSNFEVHTNISVKKANEIYENYIKKLELGKLIESKNLGSSYRMESWHTLESNTGITYTFMFKINKLIYHNPNEVIKEWNERKKFLE